MPIRPYEATLVISQQLPCTQSEQYGGHLPIAEALANLYALLGRTSQAFVCAPVSLGYYDRLHHFSWLHRFRAVLDHAFPVGQQPAMPYVFVRTSYHSPEMFGGERDSLYGGASPRLFGQQRRPINPPPVQMPADIRIYGIDALLTFRDRERMRTVDWSFHYAVLEYIVNEGGLRLDPNPRYFDARLHVWLKRAGVTSEHYRRIVLIDWEGNEPVVAHELELP